MSKIAGDGVALFWTSILLLALCWITFSMRAGVRLWRKIWGLDDIVMSIGLLLFTVTSSLCIVCSFYGSGQKAKYLSAHDIARGTKLFFIAEFFYATGAVAIKCSIAVTLLRIADTRRRYVYTVWGIMIMTAISALIFMIGIANICHPINTLWGESNGVCNLQLNSDVSLFFSAVEIATDWALAILPAVLLRNIQMKSRVKVSVACILGLAAFASCATIVRLRYLSLYSDSSEFMFGTGRIGLWSVIEEAMGIFAGSLPALRPLLSLPFLNLSTTGNSNNPTSGKNGNVPRTQHGTGKRSDINLDTFVQLGDSDIEKDDGESQKHILKETKVTVTSANRHSAPGEWEQSQILGWKGNRNSQRNIQ
ncbi:uncharacterized protein EAF02_010644 [Botrytis sinoallii]|uniref:uncharacterized protein n=1 Tax=Botrytis sinoallii TaxID=1463999 RepID=UPI0019028CAB|nr:uncharacterized protein EAF02_010644 [Botrytis sinoallii]KAF7861690.1 hypothetical protein EAF02_010644 [Botrytis sinoallii]